MSSMAILCIKCDQHVQVHIDMILPMCVLVLLFIVCCCALSFGRDRRRIKLYAQALRNAQIESCVRVKHIPSIFFLLFFPFLFQIYTQSLNESAFVRLTLIHWNGKEHLCTNVHVNSLCFSFLFMIILLCSGGLSVFF